MDIFLSKAVLDFFIAFGIVLGGAMLGGIGAVVSLQPPTDTMLEIADRIKIWALAAAVGGTIDPMRVIESNMLGGNLSGDQADSLSGVRLPGRSYGQRAGQVGMRQVEAKG